MYLNAVKCYEGFFFLNILQQNPSYWRSSYFSARLIAEGLLLLSFLLPQFIAIYWLMGLARSAAGFSLYLSFTLLCSLNSQVSHSENKVRPTFNTNITSIVIIIYVTYGIVITCNTYVNYQCVINSLLMILSLLHS